MAGTDQEERADKSADWSGEEKEGSEMEEEADTMGGAEEAGRLLTAKVRESEGSGAEAAPGGAAAGKGNTWDVTSEDAVVDEAGTGGRHGEKQRGRERVSVRRGKPSGKFYGVGIREGSPEAFRVAENPGGDCQGVGGGVELQRGIENPGVEELPRGGEISGVTPKVDRVPGSDGRTGAGRGQKLPSHPRHWEGRQQQPRRGDGEWAGAEGDTEPKTGYGRGQDRGGETAQASRRRQRRNSQAWRTSMPRVWLTGTRGAGGKPSRRGSPG